MKNLGPADAPSLLEAFGGLPFLDDAFSYTNLVTAIAGVRRIVGRRWLELDRPLEAWLSPELASKLRRAIGFDQNIPHFKLDDADLNKIGCARAAIVLDMPQWSPLIMLPTTFHGSSAPSVKSCSSYAVPQHIFLSRPVLDDSRRLAEAIIHEQCHNWMYMFQELCPFHEVRKGRTFTLPSGTANRDPAEVIGACHVAASLVRWYSSKDDEISRLRVETLLPYFHGCIRILLGMSDNELLPAGHEIVGRLSRNVTTSLEG
jgi:hypothetical protein